MGTRVILVPDLGLRGNKRLHAMLGKYLQAHTHLAVAEVARRWIADQEFWAPKGWAKELLARPDRVEVVTQAVARLICEEEGIRARRSRSRHRHHPFRLGAHAGKVSHAPIPLLTARVSR
jgi:hypothetical protein